MDMGDDPVLEEARRIDEQIFGRKATKAFYGPNLEREAADAKREAARLGPEATFPGPAATLPRRIDRRLDDSRRKRLAAASVLTRDWLPPVLGTPGLLGEGV